MLKSNNFLDRPGCRVEYPWLVAVLLFTPILCIYAIHLLAVPEGFFGTGFLQYDQAYYMANAREHFDSGRFTLFYNLPFSPYDNSPRIYFQPVILLLGVVQAVSGIDPGSLYVLFGILAGILCLRAAIALYCECAGESLSISRRTGLVLFVWGGGILTVAGVVYALLLGTDPVGKLFFFDPFEGLWFLNFGRNLLYSTEAFYHLIFFIAVLLFFRRKYGWTLVALAFLSVSHPFTGVQALLIFNVCGVIERFAGTARRPPLYYNITALVLLAVHLYYYVIFLDISPEHLSLKEQWSKDWSLSGLSILFAYCLVAVPAAWRFRNLQVLRETLSEPKNRFLVVWFFASLLLAKHDLFIKPFQPLHFTRGYIWTPLFLLGLPVLLTLLDYLAGYKRKIARYSGVVFIALIFLADNSVWLVHYASLDVKGERSMGLRLPDDSRTIFSIMNRPEFRESLVITNSHQIGYLATVYTPLRSWWSHGHNTPYAEKRINELKQFYTTGREPAEWRKRPLLVVTTQTNNPLWAMIVKRAQLDKIASLPHFIIYQRKVQQ